MEARDVMLEVAVDGIDDHVVRRVVSMAGGTCKQCRTTEGRGGAPATVCYFSVSPDVISTKGLHDFHEQITAVGATVQWFDIVGGTITERQTIQAYRWTHWHIRPGQ